MNTENTIETSDINTMTVAETTVAPTTTKTRKGKSKGKSAKTTKATRKSNRGPGRPAKQVKLIMTKTFTLKDLQTLNPDVKPITLRQHVIRAVEKGIFTRLAEGVKSGKRGKPASRFINARIHAANIARKAKQAEAVAAEVDANVEPSVV